MGGRGTRSGGLTRGGNAFTITQNANGTVTITPPPNQQTPQQVQFAGSNPGVSDVNTHTTYFSPADYAIVSNMPVDGYAISSRSGQVVPVGYYQTGYYANINTEMRDLDKGKIKALTPQTKKVADALDRNMRPANKDIDSVRWTSMDAIADNVGMRGASGSQIIAAMKNKDVVARKADYTSSSWKAQDNTVAGQAGRNVLVKMHYSKGAMIQFSPTRKEGEMLGARGTKQRFSNPRYETITMKNARAGNRTVNAFVIDCYVDE